MCKICQRYFCYFHRVCAPSSVVRFLLHGGILFDFGFGCCCWSYSNILLRFEAIKNAHVISEISAHVMLMLALVSHLLPHQWQKVIWWLNAQSWPHLTWTILNQSKRNKEQKEKKHSIVPLAVLQYLWNTGALKRDFVWVQKQVCLWVCFCSSTLAPTPQIHQRCSYKEAPPGNLEPWKYELSLPRTVLLAVRHRGHLRQVIKVACSWTGVCGERERWVWRVTASSQKASC